MSSTRIEAVLFDLDGTLLHTSPDLAVAANLALAECGLPAIEQGRIETFIGKGIDVLVQRCLREVCQPDSGTVLDRLRQAFMRHYELSNGLHASGYQGVVEGLDAFRAAGLRLGVCTNKSARFTQPLLDRFDLSHYFDVVVSGDTAPRKKPDAAPMLWACEVLALPAPAVLMIGDSDNDALGARAAGCPVWLVPYGYHGGEPVRNIDCDGIVSTLLEAALLLRSRDFCPYLNDYPHPHPNPSP